MSDPQAPANDLPTDPAAAGDEQDKRLRHEAAAERRREHDEEQGRRRQEREEARKQRQQEADEARQQRRQVTDDTQKQRRRERKNVTSMKNFRWSCGKIAPSLDSPA